MLGGRLLGCGRILLDWVGMGRVRREEVRSSIRRIEPEPEHEAGDAIVFTLVKESAISQLLCQSFVIVILDEPRLMI